MQKETAAKNIYSANELSIINNLALLKKYEENVGKFKILLNEISESEIQINKFWENSEQFIDYLSESPPLLLNAINPDFMENDSFSLNPKNEQIIRKINETMQFLLCRNLSKNISQIPDDIKTKSEEIKIMQKEVQELAKTGNDLITANIQETISKQEEEITKIQNNQKIFESLIKTEIPDYILSYEILKNALRYEIETHELFPYLDGVVSKVWLDSELENYKEIILNLEENCKEVLLKNNIQFK